MNSVHYACEPFYDVTPPTRIAAIAVKNAESNETKIFSVFKYANELSIPLNELATATEYARVEKKVLDEFYRYVNDEGRNNARWLHWNMNSETFGFPVFENRYRALGGTPIEILDANKLDLDSVIQDIYGQQYICHPKFLNLLRHNHLGGSNYRSGDREAFAFLAGKWEEIHNSVQEKPSIILEIAKLAHERKLKTHISNFRAHFWGWIESQQTDHPIMFWVTLLGVLGSFVTIGLWVWSWFHK
ncbi:MAG: hypothetical protein IPK73_31230 [Candidatus Obscuribacter sp.]|nr:hypothetical protein [Candidatus Obscuribacter sp.]MBK9281465.1 hypothetical protein [Candidatus Obscuribacter sp.]